MTNQTKFDWPGVIAPGMNFITAITSWGMQSEKISDKVNFDVISIPCKHPNPGQARLLRCSVFRKFLLNKK